MKVNLIIIAFILVACGVQKQKLSDTNIPPPDRSWQSLSQYVQHPDLKDTLCRQDIERAENDVKNGNIVLCVLSGGFGFQALRYQKQLFELCKQHNLGFRYELLGCVIVDGSTQGCYSTYMNHIIDEKYGLNFRDSIMSVADSMLSVSNDTVFYSKCDKKPFLPDIDVYKDSFKIMLPEKLSKKIIPSRYGELPYMEIGLYVDTNGIPSGFFGDGFYDAENKNIPNLERELRKLGIDQVRKYTYWEPGRIKGRKVITEVSVKVYFLKSII